MHFIDIDVDLDERGEHRLELFVPQLSDNDERTVLVLLEQIEGEIGQFDGWVEAEGVESVHSDYKRIVTFAGRMRDGATRLAVGIRSHVKARFRVFIGWVSSKICDLIRRLPCAGCKAVVRAALKAGLAAIGVPAPDGAEAKFLAADLSKLLDPELCGRIADFVDQALGEGRWEWLWSQAAKMIDPINRAYRMFDEAFEFTCRAMGFCP